MKQYLHFIRLVIRLIFGVLSPLLFTGAIRAQKISGKITNPENLPIAAVNISLLKPGSQKIIAYTLSNKEGYFYLEDPQADSCQLIFTHIGYKKQVFLLSAKPGIPLSIIMERNEALLPMVEITSQSPVRKSGDTTFFNVDAFKDSGIKKLGELVNHLPGFDWDANGTLKYNGQLVSMIMIEGEDLFQDKVNLLLSQIPIHALESVQLLENQQNNARLTGFEKGNRVFINLTLKKNRVRGSFGDTDAEVNSNSRIKINTVLFALGRKIKTGVIAGYQSLGINTSQLESEMKPALFTNTENWIAGGIQPEIYPSLPDAYYLKNNEINVRVKSNLPISKKVKSETEITFFHDRQSQHKDAHENILDSAGFISQQLISSLVRKPEIISVNELIRLNLTKEEGLDISFHWLGDFSKSSLNQEINRIGYKDSNYNHINNNNRFYNINLDYSNRISGTIAFTAKAGISNTHFSQNNGGLSFNFPAAFNIPDSGAIYLYYPLWLNGTNSFLQLNRLKKYRNGILNLGINVKYQASAFKNETDLIHPDSGNTIRIKPFSGNGKYRDLQAMGTLSYVINLFHTPVSFITSGGIRNYQGKESANFKQNSFIYNLMLQSEKQSGKFRYRSSIKFFNNLPGYHYFSSLIRPSGFNSFLQVSPPLRVIHNQQLSINFPLQIAKKAFFYWGITANRESSGIAIYSQNKGNILMVTDRFVNIPTYSLGIDANISKDFKRIKTNVHGYFATFYDQSRLLLNKEVKIKDNYFMICMLTARKKFYNNLAVNLKSRTEVSFSNSISGSNKSKAILNYSISMEGKWNLLKYFSLSANTGYFSTNNPYFSSRSFINMDLTIEYRIPQKPISFSIGVNNLLNQKQISFGDQSATYQQYYSLPLWNRNVSVSFRYEL